SVGSPSDSASRQFRMSPGGLTRYARRRRPELPPSSAAVTIAVRRCRARSSPLRPPEGKRAARRPRSRTGRPVPPPSATTRRLRLQESALEPFRSPTSISVATFTAAPCALIAPCLTHASYAEQVAGLGSSEGGPGPPSGPSLPRLRRRRRRPTEGRESTPPALSSREAAAHLARGRPVEHPRPVP